MHTDLSELVTVFTRHCKCYIGKQTAKKHSVHILVEGSLFLF